MGCVVTIGAAGCQREVARRIVAKFAYYNQPSLAGCCVTKVPFDWLLAKVNAAKMLR